MFALFGLIDGIVTLMRSSGGLAVVGVTLGLWVFVGYLIAWVQELAWSTAQGPGGDIRLGRAAWSRLISLGEERGTETDRRRLAWLSGAGVFSLFSFYFSFKFIFLFR